MGQSVIEGISLDGMRFINTVLDNSSEYGIGLSREPYSHLRLYHLSDGSVMLPLAVRDSLPYENIDSYPYIICAFDNPIMYDRLRLQTIREMLSGKKKLKLYDSTNEHLLIMMEMVNRNGRNSLGISYYGFDLLAGICKDNHIEDRLSDQLLIEFLRTLHRWYQFIMKEG